MKIYEKVKDTINNWRKSENLIWISGSHIDQKLYETTSDVSKIPCKVFRLYNDKKNNYYIELVQDNGDCNKITINYKLPDIWMKDIIKRIDENIFLYNPINPEE